jgi:hypothetical protein
MGSLLGRAVSVYLPSLSRIRASDRQMEEALRLVGGAVGNGFDTTLVVFDPAGGAAANIRSMQVYLPQGYFAQPGIHPVRLVSFHHGIEKVQRYGDSASFQARRLLLLTDPGLIERYSGIYSAVIGRGEFMALLEIPPARHRELRERIEELFVRWENDRRPDSKSR